MKSSGISYLVSLYNRTRIEMESFCVAEWAEQLKIVQYHLHKPFSFGRVQKGYNKIGLFKVGSILILGRSQNHNLQKSTH